MSDISSDKIRNLLSDPKNIELIAGLAGTMGASGLLGAISGGNSSQEKTAESVPAQPEPQALIEKDDTEGTLSPVLSSEEATLPALSNMKGTGSFPVPPAGPAISDKRIALLRAIKPYISDSKKERVDGLVRAISVAGILNNYKGGLFG